MAFPLPKDNLLYQFTPAVPTQVEEMVELQEGSLQPWCCNKRWKVTYEIRGGIDLPFAFRSLNFIYRHISFLNVWLLPLLYFFFPCKTTQDLSVSSNFLCFHFCTWLLKLCRIYLVYIVRCEPVFIFFFIFCLILPGQISQGEKEDWFSHSIMIPPLSCI